MLDPSVTNYLSKYFQLARRYFADGDLALAVFFALTLIEECGKILFLRDANLGKKEERQQALDHSEKYSLAIINLLTESERFAALPRQCKDETWHLFDPKEPRRLRNDCLYLRFDREGRLTTPERAIESDRARIIVYLAGFVAAELRKYVDIDASWSDSILRAAEAFRAEHLI